MFSDILAFEKSFKVGSQEYLLQVVDTAGQVRYTRFMWSTLFRKYLCAEVFVIIGEFALSFHFLFTTIQLLSVRGIQSKVSQRSGKRQIPWITVEGWNS